MYEKMMTPSRKAPDDDTMDRLAPEQKSGKTIRPSREYSQLIEFETVTKIDVNNIILQSVEPPDHSHLTILGTAFVVHDASRHSVDITRRYNSHGPSKCEQGIPVSPPFVTNGHGSVYLAF